MQILAEKLNFSWNLPTLSLWTDIVAISVKASITRAVLLLLLIIEGNRRVTNIELVPQDSDCIGNDSLHTLFLLVICLGLFRRLSILLKEVVLLLLFLWPLTLILLLTERLSHFVDMQLI